MEWIIKQHPVDHDQVEVYDDEEKWLLTVMHIDSFTEIPGLCDKLYDGKAVTLRVEEA